MPIESQRGGTGQRFAEEQVGTREGQRQLIQLRLVEHHETLGGELFGQVAEQAVGGQGFGHQAQCQLVVQALGQQFDILVETIEVDHQQRHSAALALQ
ncbi:hypothetical protein D9M68_951230 [compost metagenome]